MITAREESILISKIKTLEADIKYQQNQLNTLDLTVVKLLNEISDARNAIITLQNVIKSRNTIQYRQNTIT